MDHTKLPKNIMIGMELYQDILDTLTSAVSDAIKNQQSISIQTKKYNINITYSYEHKYLVIELNIPLLLESFSVSYNTFRHGLNLLIAKLNTLKINDFVFKLEGAYLQRPKVKSETIVLNQKTVKIILKQE